MYSKNLTILVLQNSLSSEYVAQLKFSKDIYRITNLRLERVGTFFVFFFARLGGNYLESHILSGNMVQLQSNLDSTRVWRRRIHQNNSLDRGSVLVVKKGARQASLLSHTHQSTSVFFCDILHEYHSSNNKN